MQEEDEPRRRHIGRVIGLAALAAVVGLCLAIPLATLLLRGAPLAALVLRLIPSVPGKLGASGITLEPRVLFDFITNRPTPVLVEGFTVTDPEGTEVMYLPRVNVKIRPRSAIGRRVVLEDVEVAPGGRWRFAEMKGKPNIGFLAAFTDPDEPDEPAVPGAVRDGILFSLANANLAGLSVRMDFPDAFGLELKDVYTAGTLIVHNGFVGWTVKDFEARQGGFFETLDEHLPWDRLKVKEAGTTRERPDDILLDVTEALTSAPDRSGGQARLSGRGYLTGIYGYGVPAGQPEPPPGIDMELTLDNAAPALAAVMAPHGLPPLHFGGQARASASLHGRFLELKINGQVAGLDAGWGELPARNAQGHFTVDAAEPFTFAVQSLRFEGGSGGTFEGSGSWRGDEVKARLDLRRFGTDAYLPAGLQSSLGGQLEGGFAFGANLLTRGLAVDDVDLRLVPRRQNKAALGGNRLRLSGRARATPETASTEGLTIELPGTRVTAKGRYGVAHQVLGFGLRATAAELPRLLAVWGLPPVARSAQLALEVRGRPSNPRAQGTLVLEALALAGLPAIAKLEAELGLEGGRAKLLSLRSQAFGGALTAGGDVRIFRGDIFHALASPTLDLRAQARGIDLEQLLPGGQLSGRVDLDAEVTGPSDHFSGAARMPAGTPLGLFGEQWRVVGCELSASNKELSIKRVRLEGGRGGLIELAGRADWDGPLALTVSVENLPLAGLPGLARGGVPIEGRLSSHLAIRGTMERPLVEGEVQLEQVSARGVHLGRGLLRLSSTEDGAVVATGDLFGRITIAGRVSYGAGGALVNLSGKFHEVLIEQFFPELAAFGNARARITGGVDLSYGGANPLTVDLRLSQLEFSADRDLGGRGGAAEGRLSVRNATPVRVVLAGNQVVVDRTRLVTEGGELKLWGELKDDVVNAELAGSLALELLQPFLGNRVEGLGGEVNLELQVSGTPQHPLGAGRVDVVRPIVIRMPGITPSIMVPTGSVRLDASALTLANVVVESEGAKLKVGGRARFNERQAVRDLDFETSGDLSGALLEAVGRGAFSDASGRARLDARITGTPESPQVKGALNLAGLNFRLRDLGRDVAMESGLCELSGQDIVIRNFRARIDGQGEFLMGVAPDPPGRIGLRGAWPAISLGTVRLPVRGNRISLRASNAVELDDIGFDLDLGGDPSRGFAIEGEVTVASGRYVRNFNVRELVITPSIDESAVEPFYAGNPLLERLGLKLRLRTLGDTFVVRNNLVPQLNVAFDLLVQGTLAQPRIAGEVRPTEGTFRLFGIRQTFDLVPNVNQITFVETKSLERGETPEVNLEAETLVNDTTNQEHRVRMRISGPIARAHIDLSTDTGLARNQALLLLISGRTGDTDSVLGAAGQRSGSGSSLGAGGTDVMGQLFSDFLEPYVDDALAKLPVVGSLNLRPTLGPEGLEVRADFRPSRLFDLRLSLLRGFESRSQYRFESRLWLMDYLTLRGLGEQITYSTQENLVEPAQSLKLELTMDFPIRLFLR